MTKGIISVKVTEIAVKQAAGIQDQDIALCNAPFTRRGDNVAIAALAGTPDQIGYVIHTLFQAFDFEGTENLNLTHPRMDKVWQVFKHI